MNNKNLPTMFIDTVSTKIDNKNTQVYYDSRYKTSNSKWTTSKPKSVIEKKLDGILNLVSKGNIINVYLVIFNKKIKYLQALNNDACKVISVAYRRRRGEGSDD